MSIHSLYSPAVRNLMHDWIPHSKHVVEKPDCILYIIAMFCTHAELLHILICIMPEYLADQPFSRKDFSIFKRRKLCMILHIIWSTILLGLKSDMCMKWHAGNVARFLSLLYEPMSSAVGFSDPPYRVTGSQDSLSRRSCVWARWTHILGCSVLGLIDPRSLYPRNHGPPWS